MWVKVGGSTVALALLLGSGAATLALALAPELPPEDEDGERMQLESPAFQHQDEIPRKYTCEGPDLAPPLDWSGVPAETQSLALIVDDPDAPDPANPRTTWVHWVLFNIPPLAPGLPEGGDPLPEGAREGVNDFQRQGYDGPCPKTGRHRYFFKLYALDAPLELDQPTKAELEAAMEGHVLAQSELIGAYEKRPR